MYSLMNEVKLFHSLTPSRMAEYQKRCNQLSVVHEYVANNQKPKQSEIHRIRSKPIRHLLLEFDHLTLIRGVLHHHTVYGRWWNTTVSSASLSPQISTPITPWWQWSSGITTHYRTITCKSILALDVRWHWLLACSMWMVSHSKRWLYGA